MSNIVVRSVGDDTAKLRTDIKMLGSILGNCLKDHDLATYESVEKLRKLGRQWREEKQGGNAFDQMVEDVKTYSADRIMGVSRAFTHFLALSNAAEAHHRNRGRRERLFNGIDNESALLVEEDTCAGVVKKLKEEYRLSADEIIEALSKQTVELVLTAHPTEVNRRTIIRKHHKIQEILQASDRPDLLPYEKRQLALALRSEVTSLWESDELRRSKPTPVDEANSGFSVVENVLWSALPQFLRKLDDVLLRTIGVPLPLHVTPIKLASWMGGDRDGNPNVTPAVTLEVSMRSRWWAATLLKADLAQLHSDISIRSGSPELNQFTNGAPEPYRKVIRSLENRLSETISWLDSKIAGTPLTVAATPMTDTAELLEPLKLLHRSLVETKNVDIAAGLLTDTIRRVSSFGLCLMPLDIRQESGRHTEALDAITRFLGVGSYAQWDEETRRNWLQAELSSSRPLLPRNRPITSFNFSPTVVDTLGTFELAASLFPGSLGAYVISQCQQASDVLAVMLLQQDAGNMDPQRVVPLFETLDDLQRAASTVDALFSIPSYRGRIGGKQEIMVGYSDSAKDAGRIAASWAQYNAQEAIVQVAEKHHVNVTFFHGKGGTVGRGGNPEVFSAILAHPPKTIKGRFRVTEQGEMITRNLGQIEIAQRTFDVLTASVLVEPFVVRPDPKPEWREMMNKLSDSSCEAYREIVRGDPRFVPYFRSATPEQDLSGLNVGSRPAKRNPKGGVESLRAIPW